MRANPFEFTRPVRNPAHFCGRQAELQALTYALDLAAADPPSFTHLAVLGRRGIGKSSLLHMVNRMAQERGFLTAHVSLNADMVRRDDLFFEELFAALQTPAAGAPAPSLQHATAARLETLARGVRERGGPGIVVLIDEADLLRESATLLQKLRNLFSDLDRCLLAVAGTEEGFPAVQQTFAPFVRLFRRIELKPFASPEETRSCVLRLLDPDLHARVDADSLLDLHELTGGVPYAVKLFGHHMYDRCTRDGGVPFALASEVFECVRLEFESYRGATCPAAPDLARLPPEASQVCALALEIPGQARATVQAVALTEILLRDAPGPQPRHFAALDNALRDLLERGVLREEFQRVYPPAGVYERYRLKYVLKESGHLSGPLSSVPIRGLLQRVGAALARSRPGTRVDIRYRTTDSSPIGLIVERASDGREAFTWHEEAPGSDAAPPGGVALRMIIPALFAPLRVSCTSLDPAAAGALAPWLDEVARRLTVAGLKVEVLGKG